MPKVSPIFTQRETGVEALDLLKTMDATIAEHAAWSVTRMVSCPVNPWPPVTAVEATANFWAMRARLAAEVGADHALDALEALDAEALDALDELDVNELVTSA